VWFRGIADGNNQTVDFDSGKFSVERFAGTPTTGLQIGDADANTYLSAHHKNWFDSVHIVNFPTGLHLVNCFRIGFQSLSVDNENFVGTSSCVKIESKGRFTGDFVFAAGCEFYTNPGQNSRIFDIQVDGPFLDQNGGVANGIAGIKWLGCNLHYGRTQLYVRATGGARVDDLFMNDSQLDNGGFFLIDAIADGTDGAGQPSQFNGWQLSPRYWKGGSNDATNTPTVSIRATNGARNGGISLGGGEWFDANGPLVLIEGCDDPHIVGPHVRDNNHQTGSVFKLLNCYGGVVHTIGFRRTVGTNYFASAVELAGTTDRVQVFGISATGIPSTSVVHNSGTGTNNRYNFVAMAAGSHAS